MSDTSRRQALYGTGDRATQNEAVRRISPAARLALCVMTLVVASHVASAQNQQAAILIDSRSVSGNFDPLSSTRLSWEHTVGEGDNRALVVGVSTTSTLPAGLPTGRVTGVTYGGAPLSRLGSKVSPDTLSAVELFQLVGPAPGAGQVVVELLPGSSYAVGGAVSLTGVVPTAPVSSFAAGASTSGAPNILISTPNQGLILDAVATTSGALFLAPAEGQTEQWNGYESFYNAFSIGAGSAKYGAGRVPVSWVSTSEQQWALAAASFNPCIFTLSSQAVQFGAGGGAGSVSISAGDQSCSWTAVSGADWVEIASPGAGTGSATLNFTVKPFGGTSRAAHIVVAGQRIDINQEGPSPVTIALTPNSLIGGNRSTATVTLKQPAPAGGAKIDLRTGDSAASVPAYVVVPAGTSTAAFRVETRPVASALTVEVAATYQSRTDKAALQILAPGLKSLSLTASSADPACQAVTGSVVLTGKAPAGGFMVALASNNPAAGVPEFVVVPEGGSTAAFPISLSAVTQPRLGQISASLGEKFFTKSLTVVPTSISDFTLSSDQATGPETVRATVKLTCPVSGSDLPVALASSFRSIARPEADIVTVVAGQSVVTFGIETADILEPYTVTLTAKIGGSVKSARLTVK
jgi:trimeric autotransporter adhesin